MKKILVFLMLCSLFCITGCFGKKNVGNFEDMKKKVEKANSYSLNGTLEIVNNDETYKYDVNVGYKKDNFYRVSLKNKVNDHEQIILKNKDGVFVVTPALNKSFKFQSDWPNNNSQVYLLQALIKDISQDKKKKTETKGDETIIATKVNYTSNPDLKTQKIYLDKESNVTKVEVLNDKGDVKIKMTYGNIDYKPKFNKDYFEVQNGSVETKTKETLKEIKNITYPMYMPENTYLKSQDKVELKDGERVILTYAGDKSFTIVEETARGEDAMKTIEVMGEPTILLDTIGSLDEKSLSWISNGIEYYAMSDELEQSELVKVANSISNNAIEK